MKKIIKLLDENLEAILGIIMIVGISILVFIQVVMRYVFSSSLSWSEELARYLFVWMTYIGTSYAVKLDKHMEVDSFVSALPAGIRKYFHLLKYVAFLVFSIIVLYYSCQLVGRFVRTGQIAASIKVPVWILYFSVLVGFLLTCIRLVQRIAAVISKEFLGKENREVKA